MRFHRLASLPLLALLLLACSSSTPKSVPAVAHSRDLKAVDTLFTKESDITIFDENGKEAWRFALPNKVSDRPHFERTVDSQEALSIGQLRDQREEMVKNGTIEEQYKDWKIIKHMTTNYDRDIVIKSNEVKLESESSYLTFIEYKCDEIASKIIGCEKGTTYGGPDILSIGPLLYQFFKMDIIENCTVNMIPELLDTHEMVWKFENNICVGLTPTGKWDPCDCP